MRSSIHNTSEFEITADVCPNSVPDCIRRKGPAIDVSQSYVPAVVPIEIVMPLRKVVSIQPNRLAVHATVPRQNPPLTSRALRWVVETVVIGFAAYGAAYCCSPLEDLKKDDNP